MRVILFAVFLLFSGQGLVLAQPTTPLLVLAGDVKTPLQLGAKELGALPRAEVKTTSDGMVAVYEGVWLHELLARAGAPVGGTLRGKAFASYLVAEAQDGYQVVFSLAEVDPAFSGRQVLVADAVDGVPLRGAQGPIRLVVSSDQRGARSVRMLTKLTVVQLRR